MKKTVIHKRADLKTNFVNGVSRTEILTGTYADVKIYYCILEEGASYKPQLFAFDDKCQFVIFVKGSGYIATNEDAHNVNEPSVFVPRFDETPFTIFAGKQMEFVQIIANMGEYDKIAIKAGAISLPRFRKMSEGWTYDEDFKAAGTKSCMLVEHRNLGRFSVGATFGKGPSCNGTHTHPDLEQWYIVLPNSRFTYESEDTSEIMTEGDVSYTSHDAPHSSTSKTGDQLDYIWFELCEGGYVGELPEDIWPMKHN